ncbi:acyl-CoA/acyl-ACP dehydrogenase [Actinoplanes sp. KI2]|uniref:acyl-CoA dehydrogenase family protein n=1 Tax=Actinoplanes sp. KI2 TaxID=2983315 RepID=UPI0021D575B0|nr:acyl-CoA dehydrogenase family protein [Actinoplanes sp. KI2]MCU7728052.1 acyl-CoA/acyl-ACP dehydrogenase [Actinoplanes sp. KI2]
MSEEHRALRDAVRGLLAGYPARAAIEQPAGYDAGLWQRLCKEIGVAGLAVPEAYGGAGATLLESHIVLAEWGRQLTPGPLLGSVLVTQALLRAGDEELLPALCAGDRIAALAWQGEFSADPAGRISGAADQVMDAEAAEILLVASGDALWEVTASDPGVTVEPADVLDPTRRLATVRLDYAPARAVGGDQMSGPPAWLRDLACVALSAEQVGAASRAFELTHEYVQQRVQFGRPIGSFQVLQHRLAEAYLRLEAATTASWTAAEALVADDAEAGTLAAMAKVHCSESLQAIAGEMVQMHGGLAITWEHDAHLYLRRAYADAQLFGAPREHLDRLTATLLA